MTSKSKQARIDAKRSGTLGGEIMDRHAVQGELHADAKDRAKVRRLGLLANGSTPIELVNFVNSSVSYLLKKEFGKKLGDDDVRIEDSFCGTGIFLDDMISRPGLLSDEELERKWDSGKLQGNEYLSEVAEKARELLADAYEKRMGKRRPCNFVECRDTFKTDPKTGEYYPGESHDPE